MVSVAKVPLKETEGVVRKFVPVIVTIAPAAALIGLKPVIVGGAKVNFASELVFPLVAASIATLSATLTVTDPAADGVMLAVYVVPLPLKFAAVPLVTEMSLRTNPVTLSLKVMVTGIGDILVGSAAEEVIATVGCVLS